MIQRQAEPLVSGVVDRAKHAVFRHQDARAGGFEPQRFGMKARGPVPYDKNVVRPDPAGDRRPVRDGIAKPLQALLEGLPAVVW